MRHNKRTWWNRTWCNWSVAGACAVLGLVTLSGCGGGTKQQGQSSRTLTAITIQGTLDPATGQFTQTGGSFEKFTGLVLANPAPPPNQPVTPEDPSGGSLYSGTYTLDSGESGEFSFTVLADNSAEGLAIPTDFFRYQTDAVSAETGAAVVGIQISGATGSGTIKLSNGTQGTIKITGQMPLTAQLRALTRRLQRK